MPQRAVELYHTGKALGVLFGRIAEIDNLMFQGRVEEAEVKYEALKQDCVAVWEGLKHKVGNASADEIAFFMGELFGDILATKGMHKGVQHLVKVVKPKVLKGMNTVGKKTKEYIEKFKNDPAGVTTAEGSIEIGSAGKNAKNAGKVGGKKAKQQVSQGTKEVAKDVSKGRNAVAKPAGKAIERTPDGLVKPLGKGSTGRAVPKNLEEQLAMKEVMSNPNPYLNGGHVLNIEMSDVKHGWLKKDGWVKVQKTIKNVNIKGDKVEIHYVWNKNTNAFDDFKFKD